MSEIENPYKAPSAPFTLPGSVSPASRYTGYAGFWIRWVAAFLDGIILQVAVLPISFVTGIVLGALMVGSEVDPRDPGPQLALQGVGAIIGLLAGLLYNALLISSKYQATLGKMTLGLKVTDLNGQRITLGRALGREMSKWLSAMILLIGYIMAAFTEKKQALHDMIASTLVFKTR
jgi:uncharacterized RDD family membrane protein YckC